MEVKGAGREGVAGSCGVLREEIGDDHTVVAGCAQGYDTPQTPIKQGFSVRKHGEQSILEPGVGIEPTTYALQVRCSTTELTRQGTTNPRRAQPFAHGSLRR